MKKLIFIISVFCVFNINAQRDINIIYVDYSASESHLDKIQDEIKKILQTNINNEIYLYLSNNVIDDNGNFTTKSITTNDVNKGISLMEDQVLQRIPPNTPDYKIDASDINSFLLEKNCLSNINSPNFKIENYLNFYFFLDEENMQYAEKNGNSIIHYIVNANRLVDDNLSIIDNCNIFTRIINSKTDSKMVLGRINILK